MIGDDAGGRAERARCRCTDSRPSGTSSSYKPFPDGRPVNTLTRRSHDNTKGDAGLHASSEALTPGARTRS